MKKYILLLTTISLALVCSLTFTPNIGVQDDQQLTATKIKAQIDDPRT